MCLPHLPQDGSDTKPEGMTIRFFCPRFSDDVSYYKHHVSQGILEGKGPHFLLGQGGTFQKFKNWAEGDNPKSKKVKGQRALWAWSAGDPDGGVGPRWGPRTPSHTPSSAIGKLRPIFPSSL